MAKPRVHEIAKEIGITSKELLAKLNEMGEYVRGPSSTLESPVVRRIRETLGTKKDEGQAAEPKTAAPKTSSKPSKPAAKSTTRAKADRPTATPGAPVVLGGEGTTTTRSVADRPTATPGAPEVLGGEGTTTRPSSGKPDSKTAAEAAPKPAAKAAGAAPKPGPKPGPKPAAPKPGSEQAQAAAPKPGSSDEGGTPAPTPGTVKPGPRPAPRPPAGRQGTPRPGAPTPASAARRSSTPRPGNNPFATSQGMGQQRQQRRPDGRQRPAGPRPGGGERAPRPGGTGGLPGMPRPNPAMMPKQQNKTVGAPPRRGGPGRGRPGGGRPGGPPGGGFGRPPMGGGPGRGRGRGGTQGAFGRGGTSGRRRKSRKQRRQEFDQMEAPTIGGVRVRKGDGQTVRLRRGASLMDLAEKIGVEAASLVQVLFHLGEMVTATQSVPDDTLEVLGAELDYNIEVVSPEDEDRELLESFDLEFGEDVGDEDDLEARPPVVTVMGHVDHGKTRLLDALRQTNTATKEAGGITQAIGAYQIDTEVDGQERAITFIDTPGHEAFTAMRARGAKSTDIAVLVVAADDGVMPQTIEALNHAKAADVPIVVAVNKIDKPEADPTRVRGQLSEYGLIPEDYGGDTQFVDVSAANGDGLEDLLEAIVLTADAALDLRANPDMPAQGVAIEAHLDRGRGPVATVLVHRGTLHIGESIVAGSAYGRVRALIDDTGENLEEAEPSRPVQVLGLTSVPGAGDNFLVVEDDRMARQIAERRAARMRAAEQAAGSRRRTLDQLFEQLEKGETQELLLILKGDGAGSVEALEDALSQVDVGEEVSLRVIDRGVGAITETNVSLAAASKAVIIGFNVRPTQHAARLANAENVDIRFHSVIYSAIEEIEAALKGMLKPIYEEEERGQAEIREIFRSSRFGNIAGCMVIEGSVKRNQKARLLREGVVISDTTIQSLRREKDDVTEVREGFECGLTLANAKDIQIGDIVETYDVVERERS